jgi:hypothetical protein
MRCRRMRLRTKCEDVYAYLVSQRSPALIQSSGTPQASQVSPSLTVDRSIDAHFLFCVPSFPTAFSQLPVSLPRIF